MNAEYGIYVCKYTAFVMSRETASDHHPWAVGCCQDLSFRHGAYKKDRHASFGHRS